MPPLEHYLFKVNLLSNCNATPRCTAQPSAMGQPGAEPESEAPQPHPEV